MEIEKKQNEAEFAKNASTKMQIEDNKQTQKTKSSSLAEVNVHLGLVSLFSSRKLRNRKKTNFSEKQKK